MKLSSITASPERPKKFQRKGAMSGGYNWELGSLVFDDPIKQIGKAAKAREKARETWQANGNKSANKSNEKANFHLKHG